MLVFPFRFGSDTNFLKFHVPVALSQRATTRDILIKEVFKLFQSFCR